MSMPKPTKPIRWIQYSPSISKDVVTYRVRMVPTGQDIEYSGAYDDVGMGKWNSHTRKITIDLYKIPGYRSIAKGNYDFGLTAVDKAFISTFFFKQINASSSGSKAIISEYG